VSDSRGLFEFGGLEANKDGRLSEGQLGRLRDYSRSARNGNMLTAVFMAFIGLVMIVLPGSKNMLIVPGFDFSIIAFSSAFLAIAGYFLVRGLFGTDPLSRDLRNPVVRTVDGSIRKHFHDYGRRWTRVRRYFYIDAGRMRMQAFPDDYDGVPAGGTGRVYYLRHSRWFLSFEAPAERGFAADRPEHRNDRPLDQVIVGTWTNGTVTLEFKPDGTAVGTLPGGGMQTSHWSVDLDGRLVADFSGVRMAADVWITDEGITLNGEGREMKLTRVAG
jgi:hypothetical protein